jgi:hypothetical protein
LQNVRLRRSGIVPRALARCLNSDPRRLGARPRLPPGCN